MMQKSSLTGFLELAIQKRKILRYMRKYFTVAYEILHHENNIQAEHSYPETFGHLPSGAMHGRNDESDHKDEHAHGEQ